MKLVIQFSVFEYISKQFSRTHQHAYALELLYDKLYAGGHVLDVGSGSGYLTACFARAVQQKDGSAEGIVVGIEHQPQLVKLAMDNIKSDDDTLIASGQVVIIGKYNL